MSRILDFADGFSSATEPSVAGGINTVATQDISASGTIALPASGASLVRVAGDGGAVNASATPFSGTPTDGQILYVMGTDDTNTVTIPQGTQGTADEAVLNGSATLGQGNVLVLVYLETEDNYFEITRNF